MELHESLDRLWVDRDRDPDYMSKHRRQELLHFKLTADPPVAWDAPASSSEILP